MRRYLMLALALMGMPAAAEDAPAFKTLTGTYMTPAQFRGQQTLIAFWRSDCAPCRAEKPALLAAASAHDDLRIALVSLQDAAETRKYFPAAPAANIQLLLAKDDAGQTLRQMGDANSALPFSVFLRKDGTVCATHGGLLGTDRIDEWMKQC